MQKLYLLLRNNRQSGPHSYDEMVQLQPKPYDLVWVEGKSQSWRYPGELDEFKHLLAAPTQAAPAPMPKASVAPAPASPVPHPHIFVSLPSGRVPVKDPLEERAEDLRQKIARLNTTHLSDSAGALDTRYSRDMDTVSEDYGKWLYQAKTVRKKRLTARKLAGTLVVLAGLAGGWWLGRMALTPAPLTLAQQQTLSGAGSNQAKAPANTVVKDVASASVNEEVSAAARVVSAPPAVLKATTEKRPAGKKQAAPVTITVPQPVADTHSTAGTQEVPQPTSSATTPEKETSAAEEPKKKKGFFARLFGKKEKEAQPVQRSETDISRQVELKLKEDNSHWMMGVKGAKFSLRNNSEVPLKAAAVEVSYFTEADELLEKKTVQINGVDAGKTKTFSIPDHRTAEKISCRLVSATGEVVALARQ